METTLHYLAFDEIGITVAVIAVACAFIVLVLNTVKAIKEWIASLKKPDKDTIAEIKKEQAEHDERITNLEKCCDEVHGKLDNDFEFQKAEVEMNRLLLKSIKQLLKHAIDGNDTAGLEAVEGEIDDYLMKKTL